MKQYEHMIIHSESELMEVGKDGWKVVGSYYYGGWTFIMEKEVIE